MGRKSEILGGTTTGYEMGTLGWGNNFFGCWDANNQVGHIQVVFGTGDAAGLATVQNLALASQSAQMSNANCDFGRLTYDGKNMGFQMVERIFLSYILENCVQLNLQGILYSLVAATF